jgi:diaminohydroxyphosphoribosylaminopyrimidine deaminase/5-amino-6-(5-phosphoribosylamino)uracil reductase
MSDPSDAHWMRQALELALQGEGQVEPNPMVGCVIVRDGRCIARGWHQAFGGPHAEVEAVRECDPQQLDGATFYVTLEPCAHHGKTPPCVDLLIASKPARVVIGAVDPFPAVRGKGIERLRQAGITVDVGCLLPDARRLIAPFRKRIETGMPWVIAKWAMTLDGRIASRTGSSQWISNPASRAQVHQMRGRVDAILIGIGTALADNPSLTPRPPGPRTPRRIVLDRSLRLPLDGQLACTARQVPLEVWTSPKADPQRYDKLRQLGVQIRLFDQAPESLAALLRAIAAEGVTNLLVEGGGAVLGTFFDQQWVDEVAVFVAPGVLGGRQAKDPVGGEGIPLASQQLRFADGSWDCFDGDFCYRGRRFDPQESGGDLGGSSEAAATDSKSKS